MNLEAACAFGLESVVKWELKDLGFEPRVVSPGRVGFEGDWDSVAKANLWLRTADRVLIRLLEFEAADFDALFETVKSFDWCEWLPKDASFPVNGRSRLSTLTSVPAVQRTVKKAIVESMLAGHNAVQLNEDGAKYPVEVALLNDNAAITLDTTGPSLHKRGYRTSYGIAPLKETLAASMVMLSVWNPQRPLVDPFCGSGTIAIEAAMIARGMAPGRNREFNWQSWNVKADIEIEAGENLDSELQISATDVDENVLKLARRNAERAGVADAIHFQEKSFEELRSKRRFGCVITNPPYGERLSDQKQLLPLYKSFPAVLQRLPTWSHFVLTSMPRFEAIVQKSATRRRKLFNGRIECMYYQFLGPRPPAPGPDESANELGIEDRRDDVAVFGGLQDEDKAQADLFATRLLKRARHLRRWPTKRGITCFRLYERDIPELPFVLDRYENQFHLTEYDRPHSRDPGRHAAWLELMKKTVSSTFEVPIHSVHLKSRRTQSGKSQHLKVGESKKRLIVDEGGLKFIVNLVDYVDTGLFLDHRMTREMVRSEAENKRVLNLFCYTGAFSVYAAAGGAASTISVDWSHTYLDWARENMAMNGFDGDQHQFLRMDCTEFIRSRKPSEKFDLVIVDPPTFSNSKRTEDIWDVQRDHVGLLHSIGEHVVSGGTVYFSTNFRKFKFDASSFGTFEVREISKQTVPEDFRNKKIHRCWKLIRK